MIDDGGDDDDDDGDGQDDDDDDDDDDGDGGGGDDDVEARDGPGAPVSSAAQLGRHWQDIQPSQKDSEKFNIVKYLFHQLQRASAPIGMIFAKKKSPFHLNYLGTIQPTRVPKEHLVQLFTKKTNMRENANPFGSEYLTNKNARQPNGCLCILVFLATKHCPVQEFVFLKV